MIPVETIQDRIRDTTSLEEIKEEIIKILQALKERGVIKIGYVAGVVTADGPENVEANLRRLIGWTEAVGRTVDFPVFSAASVFNPGVYQRSGIDGLPYAESSERFKTFWRGILPECTDIFMTPGWERSIGSSDEHQTAQELSLQIHILKEDFPK